MSRRGLRGASLGKRNYPPESYYVEFDDLGTATGANSGRFNTWFSIQVKSRISYHLEWNKVTDEMKDQLWLCTEETWNFTPSSTAKTTHLKKANLIHGKFKSMLVTNYEKSEKAKQSALKNKDPARVGRWGYSGLRAYWRTNKDALVELFSKLGVLQSERAILHVLGRLRRNKNTGLKELTSDVQERLNKLVLKEREMKADGSFFVAGKDPLIGVLGPEHPGRTRAVSSVVGFKKALGSVGGKRKKKVTIEDLEGMRAQMMEDMETIVRAKVMEELVVQGNNTTLQGTSFGHSDGHSTGVSAESVDTFDEIEECDLMFVHFGTECRVAKGVIYPSNGMLHGKPMDPGFLKIQVDTVDDGWDEVIVPKPTDEVKTLKDAKGGQFIQWPRKYIKVLGRMSSNDSMSLPTSIPPLTSPTTSAPVLCQMVQQELPSQATASWSGSKTINPIQEEDDTIKKCMEVLPAWTGSKKAIPTRNGNNTIQECMELLLRRPAEIQRLASKFIERPERDDQILVMSHPGMYVERFFEYVEYSSLLAWMTNSWLDGTLIHWWAIYLYGCAERRFPGHNKCAILNPSLVHWRMCRENNGAPAMNHIQQTFAAHKDKTIFIAPYLQDSHWVLFIICPLTKTGYILDSSNRNMRKTPRLYKLTSIVERTCKMQINWTMVKCHQQEADWECGYYVSIAMFQLMFRLQEDFPADLWEDMSPIEQKHIDEWVLSSASQFFTFYLEN
ncbi:ulp1 protease family, C-terminal catalytic domain-containing protein [Tanacetum coccineum]